MSFIDVIPQILIAFFTALITWFFARRKNAAEVDSMELDNVDKATGIWRQLAEDLKLEVDTLRNNQQRILTEQSLILSENRELNQKVNDLTTQNAKLTKEIRTLETKVQSLTRENKKLIAQLTSK